MNRSLVTKFQMSITNCRDDVTEAPDLESLGRTEEDEKLSLCSTNISEEQADETSGQNSDQNVPTASSRAWGSAKTDPSRGKRHKQDKLLTRRNSHGPSKLGKNSTCCIFAQLRVSGIKMRQLVLNYVTFTSFHRMFLNNGDW